MSVDKDVDAVDVAVVGAMGTSVDEDVDAVDDVGATGDVAVVGATGTSVDEDAGVGLDAAFKANKMISIPISFHVMSTYLADRRPIEDSSGIHGRFPCG